MLIEADAQQLWKRVAALGSVLFAGQRREASALVNKNAFIGFVAGLGWAPTDGVFPRRHKGAVWPHAH
jgi:hypothetical protein